MPDISFDQTIAIAGKLKGGDPDAAIKLAATLAAGGAAMAIGIPPPAAQFIGGAVVEIGPKLAKALAGQSWAESHKYLGDRRAYAHARASQIASLGTKLGFKDTDFKNEPHWGPGFTAGDWYWNHLPDVRVAGHAPEEHVSDETFFRDSATLLRNAAIREAAKHAAAKHQKVVGEREVAEQAAKVKVVLPPSPKPLTPAPPKRELAALRPSTPTPRAPSKPQAQAPQASPAATYTPYPPPGALSGGLNGLDAPPHHPGGHPVHFGRPMRPFRRGGGPHFWPGSWGGIPWATEVVTTTETCQTWGDPIEMPHGMQIAAKAALGASGGKPTTTRGPDGVLYLFSMEGGTPTARPCAAVATA